MNTPTKANETQVKLCEELDKALLDGVVNGVPIVVGKDDSGMPIIEKIKTAAWLNVARQRIKDLSIDADAGNKETNAGKLIDEMKKNGTLKLHQAPLDDEAEDRATA